MRPQSASEHFHRLLLLGVQRLRGRPVGAYIRKLQEWERLEPQEFERLRAQRLIQTLEYASTRVPLYRSGAWHEALRRANAGVLQSWPVLDRETIQANPKELLAQPSPRGYYFRRTSGSSGKPLGVAMDADAAAWGGPRITGASSGIAFPSVLGPCLSISGVRACWPNGSGTGHLSLPAICPPRA